MDGMQASRRRMAAQDLPAEALERILAQLPTNQERLNAAAVCRAWRQLLSRRNLWLWQAVRIERTGKWDTGVDDVGYPDYNDPTGTLFTARLRMFLPLQQWLVRHGDDLLQLQCSTAFTTAGMSEDGLLTALLAAIPAAAPSLQALRLDSYAAAGMVNSSLAGVAGMGGRLRQLAILGLQHVSDSCLLAALEQLPLLQDLAIMFIDEEVREDQLQLYQDDTAPYYGQPDISRLLDSIAASCPALQTLALGNLPSAGPRFSTLTKFAAPLPASLSRLTALSSLALHAITWEPAPAGLPNMPQLRRLCLRGDCRLPSMLQPELPHQLSTLTGVEALQVTLPRWVGRLPAALTQLVLSPYKHGPAHPAAAAERPAEAIAFFRTHLPPLGRLRHLAIHNDQEIGDGLLQDVCAGAKALPQLISLHLYGLYLLSDSDVRSTSELAQCEMVQHCNCTCSICFTTASAFHRLMVACICYAQVNCNISVVPRELCGLSHLQLLNLSHNPLLHADGCRSLAQAPLHELVSCKWLDLRCEDHDRKVPLQPDTVAIIAGMPALEQLALAPTVPYVPRPDLTAEEIGYLKQPERLVIPSVYTDSDLTPDETEVALLAQHRAASLPPIEIVPEMPVSDHWAAVAVDLPFKPVNEVLGVQLERSIIRGVPP